MNNILWQQNSCPCNEYSAEAGVAGKQEIMADGDQTHISHLREEIKWEETH